MHPGDLWNAPFAIGRASPGAFIFIAALVTGVTLVAVSRVIVVNHGFPIRMPTIEGEADVGAYRNECLDLHDLSLSRLAEMDACQLGDRTAKIDFLLIGDSHAAALADGIDAAAFRRGRHGLVVAANACLPILGLQGQFPRSKEACRRVHESLIDLIDHFGIGLVLMHARWRAIDEDGVVSAGDLKSKSPLQAISEHLLDTLTRFESHGASVTIISDTPRALFRVPDILARKALYNLDVDERPSLAAYLGQNSGARHIFEQPEILAHARIFDVYPFFCQAVNGGFCDVAERGRPYFWDDNHLEFIRVPGLVAFGVRYLHITVRRIRRDRSSEFAYRSGCCAPVIFDAEHPSDRLALPYERSTARCHLTGTIFLQSEKEIGSDCPIGVPNQ